MKTGNLIIVIFTATVLVLILFVNSCAPSAEVSGKPGAQLWAENCQRCHNTPPPLVYDDKQWDAVVTHMQIRANITQEEADKIVAFLQESN
ncbi:cytochrome c [Pontibacter sp. E15-1]|uniref:c-type cytochrome n=1 Tax=Pontibacter sp. E15-1 TaxID=2919918 RepID=UPI001F4FEE60|nr:cytochrome c [Pontibacter sp. E15-1]MCJ8163384.1 cytochrome c [Pontibacter sp. E15-1]